MANKGGRPPFWTPAKKAKAKAEFLERSELGEPGAQICRDKHMPNLVTIYRWQDEDPEFGNDCERARATGTDYMAADCMKIADEKGGDPADKRIRIDTRLRLMGMWNRRVYGNKVDAEVKQDVTVTIKGKDADL